tara:strand:+ start:431 stop:928 length:498 start_codon:yes stop_codon:yes gene_type:complete
MNLNIFHLTLYFLTISIYVQSQSFNNKFEQSQSKAYALLDLGFSAKFLHLNSEGTNTIVKKEDIKKSPRSIEEILAKSKNEKLEDIINDVNSNKYHLVVGCFSNIYNAQRLVSKLNDQGYSTNILGQNDRGLYIVTFGSYTSKSVARRDLKTLSTQGINTWIKTN